MTPAETLEIYREPVTRAVGLVASPPNHSTDNPVVFTAAARKVGLIAEMDLYKVAHCYLDDNGFLLRYPDSKEYCSWDDHVAGLAQCPALAASIVPALQKFDYTLPNGNYLGRFPVLKAIAQAQTGGELSMLAQLQVAGAYLINCAESRDETSGKQLLWLAAEILSERYPFLGAVIETWSIAMDMKYPGGPREMLGIYYHPTHPIVQAAPEVWT